jgi:P4 family phage/plasmid primase-like protien
VRRPLGYTLTGDTREQIMAVLHGGGSNGKSRFINVVRHLLGGLAADTPFTTFLATRRDHSPRNDLAGLHRARVVTAKESAAGATLDAAVIKECTGGDPITTRFLHKEFFTYKPEFKIYLTTNHRPQVDADDDALWRRLRLVPFNVKFHDSPADPSDRDPNKLYKDAELDAKLEAELPGILNWALSGCLQWQRDGLGNAEAVRKATEGYRESEDPLHMFLRECCVRGEQHSVSPEDFRAAYTRYCHDIDKKPLSGIALGKKLRAPEHKITKTQVQHEGRRERRYLGVALRRPRRPRSRALSTTTNQPEGNPSHESLHPAPADLRLRGRPRLPALPRCRLWGSHHRASQRGPRARRAALPLGPPGGLPPAHLRPQAHRPLAGAAPPDHQPRRQLGHPAVEAA